MKVQYYQSPIGLLKLVSEENKLAEIHFSDKKTTEESAVPVLEEAVQQLQEYFGGVRTSFDLPLFAKGTGFQKKVWNELQNIPFGSTITYQELSRRLGSKNAMRAAGRANGRNPISIVIPCHRVIGTDGKLTGYVGGVERKLWLLRHEGALLL